MVLVIDLPIMCQAIAIVATKLTNIAKEQLHTDKMLRNYSRFHLHNRFFELGNAVLYSNMLMKN